MTASAAGLNAFRSAFQSAIFGLCLAGCVGCDPRLVAELKTAANRQAQQNTAMAELQKEVAKGTGALILSEEKSRSQIIRAQEGLDDVRKKLLEDFRTLEVGRKKLAEERRRESILLKSAEWGSAFPITWLGISVVGKIFARLPADAIDAADIVNLLPPHVFSGHAPSPLPQAQDPSKAIEQLRDKDSVS